MSVQDKNGLNLEIGATVALDKTVLEDNGRWVNGRGHPITATAAPDGSHGIVIALVKAGLPPENQPSMPRPGPQPKLLPGQTGPRKTIDEHHGWAAGSPKVRVAIVDGNGTHWIWAKASEVTLVTQGVPPGAELAA